MKPNEPAARRDAGCGDLRGEALERHLFVCPDCRVDVRLSAAWDALRGERTDGPAAEAGDAFVARVLRATRREGSRQRRWRLLLAAAAVLLFFFAAGANSRRRTTESPNAEDVYASLAAPSSALDGLLPE